jgi:hypothetical protein
MTEIRFALYVSAVRGHLVTRFGTAGRGVQSFIGAHRAPGSPTEIVWDVESITALSEDEVARHLREYQRLLDGGALKKRTAAEYRAQVADRTKPEPETVAEAKPETEAVAEAKPETEPKAVAEIAPAVHQHTEPKQ